MKKYGRTAVMVILMAGVVVSVLTSSGYVSTAGTILLALTVVMGTSSADYWRARCRRAENEEPRITR